MTKTGKMLGLSLEPKHPASVLLFQQGETPALRVIGADPRSRTSTTVPVVLLSCSREPGLRANLKPVVNCQPSYRGRALSPGRQQSSLKINKIFKFFNFSKFFDLQY